MSKSISIYDLERKIFEKEEIRVVIRSDGGKMFDDYDYQRKAAEKTSVTEWYNQRLKPILGDGIDAVVIDGHGNIPHGRTNMETIRNSYQEK